jgi:hypothetical protein
MNSKQYLGSDRSKEYCLCAVKILSKKLNNIKIDELFKKRSEEIVIGTEFASIHCEKNKKLFNLFIFYIHQLIQDYTFFHRSK